MPQVPMTRDQAVAKGYKFSNHGRCKGCHVEMEWWLTPAGRKQPVNLMQTGQTLYIAHHATCTHVEEFRK